MTTTTTPVRDRIAAITITLLLHALVVVPVLMWHSGGRPGRGPRDAAGNGQESWIAADFLGTPQQAVPKPVPLVVAPAPAPARDSSMSEPATADASATLRNPSTQDAASPAGARQGGGDGAPQDDLGARYLGAVRAAVLEQWNAQGGGNIPAGCRLRIDQADGGRVLRVWMMECGELPMQDRIRLEAAVMRAQSLPYAGFESVFQEHLELKF